MKISDCPYKKTTTLKSAVKWLNKNKARICKQEEDAFDYPDYWGMPVSVANKLSSDAVDWIQEETYEWWTGDSQ